MVQFFHLHHAEQNIIIQPLLSHPLQQLEVMLHLLHLQLKVMPMMLVKNAVLQLLLLKYYVHTPLLIIMHEHHLHALNPLQHNLTLQKVMMQLQYPHNTGQEHLRQQLIMQHPIPRVMLHYPINLSP